MQLTVEEETPLDFPDMESLTPMEFMELVGSIDPQPAGEPDEDGTIRLYNQLPTPDSFPSNWVTREDLKPLMGMLKKDGKCPCMLSPLSSTLPAPSEYGTLRGYAVLLINSYRNKEPIVLGGTYECPRTTKSEIQEILAWWENQEG